MLQALFAQTLAHAPEVILTIITAIVIPFAVAWLRANTSKTNLERIAQAADVAYLGVDNIARKTPGKLDDKAALAIDVLRRDLRQKIAKNDEPVVRAILTARHEAAKAKAAAAMGLNLPDRK